LVIPLRCSLLCGSSAACRPNALMHFLLVSRECCPDGPFSARDFIRLKGEPPNGFLVVRVRRNVERIVNSRQFKCGRLTFALENIAFSACGGTIGLGNHAGTVARRGPLDVTENTLSNRGAVRWDAGVVFSLRFYPHNDETDRCEARSGTVRPSSRIIPCRSETRESRRAKILFSNLNQ
jgi:hypothetical protein